MWLFRSSMVMIALGVVSIALVLWKSNAWLHRLGMLIGAINLVMGERFFNNPTYDIFYNNSKQMVFQMALGFLGLVLAFLQARRRRLGES